MWSVLFGKSAARMAAGHLYGQIVDEARRPIYYADLGVADTTDGRFDMISLVAALVFRRLSRADAPGRALAQRCFDIMFDDFDRNLREMGVGPDAVPHRIADMTQAFYGRAMAYDSALSESAPDHLSSALMRNVYRGADGAGGAVDALALRVRGLVAWLDGRPDEELLAGRLGFCDKGP